MAVLNCRPTIVFLPGLKGSILDDGVWIPSDRYLNSLLRTGSLGSSFFETAIKSRNSRLPDGSSSTGIIGGIVSVGNVYKTANDYGLYIEKLARLVDQYTCELLLFPYDWREQPTTVAQCLAAFLEYHRFSAPRKLSFERKNTFFGHVLYAHTRCPLFPASESSSSLPLPLPPRLYILLSHSFGDFPVDEYLNISSRPDFVYATISLAAPANGATNVLSWLNGKKTSMLFSRDEITYLMAHFDSMRNIVNEHHDKNKKQKRTLQAEVEFTTRIHEDGVETMLVEDCLESKPTICGRRFVRRISAHVTLVANQYLVNIPCASKKAPVKMACVGDGTVDYKCNISTKQISNVVSSNFEKIKKNEHLLREKRSLWSFYWMIVAKLFRDQKNINHHKRILFRGDTFDIVERTLAAALSLSR